MERKQNMWWYLPPDGPTNRSVTIATSTPDEMYKVRSAAGFPNVEKDDYRRSKSMSAEPTGRHGSVVAPTMEKKERRTNRKGRVSRASNWRVRDGSLSSVPHYYPLEKTNTTVGTWEGTPSDISHRLSEAFRMLSISAIFDDKEGFADLVSPDHVEMKVNLFKHPKGGTVVEVQRRRGCSISFHHYARSILAASRGIPLLNSASIEMRTIAPFTPPWLRVREPFEENKFANEERKAKADTIEALEIASNLLRNDRIDANRLGMESLVLLTQPRTTSALTAKMSSLAVLCGRADLSTEGAGNCGDNSEDDTALATIRETVTSLIKNKEMPRDKENASVLAQTKKRGANYPTYRLSPRHAIVAEEMEIMHNFALCALANALDVLEEVGELSDVVCTQGWLNGPDLLSDLLEDLRHAESRPHDACLSARCLCRLVGSSKKLRDIANSLDALGVASQAKDVGMSCHKNLEQESARACHALAS